MKKYQVIYADPPWSYDDKMSGHSFSLDHEYQTQDLEWIKNLGVGGSQTKTAFYFSGQSPPYYLRLLRS